MYLKFAVSKKYEGGFLVPLAAIIVVGLGVLALAISRISGQGATSTVQEGLAVQSYYAADSGAQYGMNRLFFSATTRAQVDTNCASLSGSVLNYSVSGLSLCSSSIRCSLSTDAGNTTSFYLITSAATCGTGESMAERSIAVSAFMK